MLKKHPDYQESLIHVCKEMKAANNYEVIIRIHDIHSFMDIGATTMPIKCCPFCGIELEKEL